MKQAYYYFLMCWHFFITLPSLLHLRGRGSKRWWRHAAADETRSHRQPLGNEATLRDEPRSIYRSQFRVKFSRIVSVNLLSKRNLLSSSVYGVAHLIRICIESETDAAMWREVHWRLVFTLSLLLKVESRSLQKCSLVVNERHSVKVRILYGGGGVRSF